MDPVLDDIPYHQRQGIAEAVGTPGEREAALLLNAREFGLGQRIVIFGRERAAL